MSQLGGEGDFGTWWVESGEAAPHPTRPGRQDHPAWTSLVSRQSCAPTPCPWPSILPQHLLCPSLLAPPRSVGGPGVLLSRINNGQPPTTAVKVQGSLFSAPCHSRASLGCQASTTCCEHSPAAPPGLAHSTLLPRLHPAAFLRDRPKAPSTQRTHPILTPDSSLGLVPPPGGGGAARVRGTASRGRTPPLHPHRPWQGPNKRDKVTISAAAARQRLKSTLGAHVRPQAPDP